MELQLFEAQREEDAVWVCVQGVGSGQSEFFIPQEDGGFVAWT